MTNEVVGKIYFVKLGTGEDLFTRITSKQLPTHLIMEDPMIIEPIEHQGGRHLMMTRFLPYVKGPLEVRMSHITICQEANDMMSRYYEATLEYQTKDGGDERFAQGVERAVHASKNETPASQKDFNERLLCSSMAILTETKH